MKNRGRILPVVAVVGLAAVALAVEARSKPAQQAARAPATQAPGAQTQAPEAQTPPAQTSQSPESQAPETSPAQTSPAPPTQTPETTAPAATPAPAGGQPTGSEAAAGGTAAAKNAANAKSPVLPNGPGKEIVENVCTQCHGLQRIVESHNSKAVWQDTVEAMYDRGADLDDAEIPIVVNYLSDNFPRAVNVNHAAAGELVSVLGITPVQAAAIVDYRTQNGPFTTLADLEKVPGLEAATVETWKLIVIF